MNRLIYILLFLIIACEKKQNSFYDDTSERFLYAHNIKLNALNLKNKFIPKNTWFLVMELNLISKNYFNIKDCLFYYESDEKSEIKWVKDTYDCNDPYQEGIIYHSDKIDLLEVEKNNLVIHFKKYTYKYPMINLLKKSNQKYQTDLYSHGVDETYHAGVKIISPFLQEKFKRPLLNEGEICHDVADDCSDSVRNQCHLCPEGWYSEIHGNCSKKLRKRCGTLDCGGKGQIACLRGFVVTGLSLDFCFPDSPLGYCAEGLRVVCKEKTLYCE